MKRFLNIIWIVIIFVAIALWVAMIWPWYIAVSLLITRVLFLLVMSAIPKLNYYLDAIHKGTKAQENTIALTFDDGPSIYTETVLNLLKSYHMKATFFCIGKHIEAHPEIFKRILAEGHEVGNHTYSHSYWLGFFGKKRLRRDIEMCDLVAQEHGDVSLKYYRPPFGITNPMLRNALKLTNHQCICWSKRSYDTISKNQDDVFQRLTSNLQTGDILLMHDTLEHTPKTLKRLLYHLERRGLKSVTISQLLNA